MKRKIANKEAKNIVKITEEAFSNITIESQNKECDHVTKVEEKYNNVGISIDNEIGRFIIEVKDGRDTSTVDNGGSASIMVATSLTWNS